MAERSVTVGSKVGLHARPAMLFTQAVAASGAKVTISRPGAAGVDASMHLVRDGHGCGPRRGGRPRERQRSRSRPTRRDARDRPRRKVGRDRVAESAGRTAGDGRRGPARPLRDGVAGPQGPRRSRPPLLEIAPVPWHHRSGRGVADRATLHRHRPLHRANACPAGLGCKRPAIWRGVCERPRSASTLDRSTGSAATLPGWGRARRRCARQSAVTILYPRVVVVLRRTSRETTDAHRSMCAAIARIDHPAFSPEAISTRSPTVNILRTHNPLLDQHRCYDAMTPPTGTPYSAR